MDLLSGQLFVAARYGCCQFVNDFTRFLPALDERHSFKRSDVDDTLERIATDYGHPRRVGVDNEPEFLSKNPFQWAYQLDVLLDFSRLDNPADNAYGGVISECLNTNWFVSLEAAQAKCEAWRSDFNEVRPHSFPGN